MRNQTVLDQPLERLERLEKLERLEMIVMKMPVTRCLIQPNQSPGSFQPHLLVSILISDKLHIETVSMS